jgi:hypothetical protein
MMHRFACKATSFSVLCLTPATGLTTFTPSTFPQSSSVLGSSGGGSGGGFLMESRRHKVGQVGDLIVNFDNPPQALMNVREAIAKLEEQGRDNGTLWMHHQINLALCHFHLGDLQLAYDCARFAHDTICKHRGSDHHSAYFSAITLKRTAQGLREKLEELIEVREDAPLMDKITMGAHKADEAKSLVGSLKREEMEAENLAQRLYWSPKHYYMRQRETKFAQAAWDDQDDRAYDEGKMHRSPWDKRKRKAPAHKAERSHRNKTSRFRTPK